MEALTSSYALSKEVKFSKREYKENLRLEKIMRRDKGKEKLEKDVPEKDLTKAQLKKMEEEKKKEEGKKGTQQVPGAVAQPQPPAAAPAPAQPKIEEKPKEELKKKGYVGPDIAGYIYFKGEWKGEGSEMPPLIRLIIENEMKEDLETKEKQIKQSKLIDLNDPRYQWIVKNHKENNEHLQKLIEKDSLNPLHDLEPFRHIQLINQETHFELVNVDIPILEQEVVNDPLLSYYIEKFSKLGAMQTYDKMMKEVKSYSGSERLQDMSAEVLERRQKFMEKLKRVEKDIKTGKNKPNINYTSVVREFIGDAKNPCAGLLEKAFAPRRKLRPRIKDKVSVSIASVSQATIKVHIISGINIPIRSESLQAIEILNQQINNQNNSGMPPRGGMMPNRLPGPGQDYGRDPRFPPNNLPYNPYDRDRFDRTGRRSGGQYPDNYLGVPPGRGAATDFRGTGRDQLSGYDRGYGASLNTGYQDRFGPTQSLQPALMERNPPNYSGYGVVANPYGTIAGRGPLSGLGATLRGNPNQAQRNFGGNQDMSYLQQTQMELTGLSRLIQGSVFIEVRLTSERTGDDFIQVKRTRECTGSFPDWNETLSFNLISKSGKAFTEEELIKGNDTLYFSIYDKHETERHIPSTNKHEITVENKFLGSFSIKLISILQNFLKMEGQIRVDRPLNLQGYGMLPSGLLSSNIFNKDIDTELLPTYISLSVNLDPLLELPAENEYDYYPGGEDAKLLRAGALWANDNRRVAKGPPKIVKLFGENVERKSILICRYLVSQAPPRQLIDLEHDPENMIAYAIQKAARFVSLIPFLDDNSAFGGEFTDMWCTSQEFIDFNGGDYEEHAILL